MIHKVNIAHYRLVQLSELADQEKPFYDWVERSAQNLFNTGKSLNSILMNESLDNISKLIKQIMEKDGSDMPILCDGGGRPYVHKKAVFFFFAWLIRDAPQQRLAPLISKMRKVDDPNLKPEELQTDSLANLIVRYRSNVNNFEWLNFREVLINRLEGSRRSLHGHEIENTVRLAFSSALQTYYKTHFDYGNYDVTLSKKQIKIGNDSVDVNVKLTDKNTHKIKNIYVPVKSRETEGGGHAHLFSRDIITAINNIKKNEPSARFIVVIIAENWDEKELETISDNIDIIFHFDMNPNEFSTFDEKTQPTLNKYIKGILSDTNE